MKNTNNLNKRFLLTLDIDWCPDYMLDWVVELLISLEVPAVFFVTHNTPILQKIRLNSLFALGIHPNFNPGSTHGKTIEEIYQHVLEIVPEAIISRSHSLNISSTHLDFLLNKTKILIETSVLFPFYNNAEFCIYEQKGKTIYRIPYIFDDYYALENQIPLKDQLVKLMKLNGLSNIVNFHPVHLYLNSPSISEYEENKISIFCSSYKFIPRHFSSKYGAQDFFLDFVECLNNDSGCFPDFLIDLIKRNNLQK